MAEIAHSFKPLTSPTLSLVMAPFVYRPVSESLIGHEQMCQTGATKG